MTFNPIPPAFITYKELPAPVGGRARGPFITILPRLKGDEGLLRHELAHVQVWWLTLGLSPFLSIFFRRFKLWNEARAYRIQMKYPDLHGDYLSLDDAAARLAGPHYHFGITIEQAKKFILKRGQCP